MPITYAGIPLTPTVEAAQTAASRWWHGHREEQWEFQGYLQQDTQHLPGPFWPVREPPRIGVLHWPVGADRWSTCHLAITGAQRTQLQAAIGTVPGAKPLVFSDGTTSITAQMYVVGLNPISQRGDNKEYYLLTLADERYFWWTTGGTATPTSITTWDALLDDLFVSLGVTASIDATPAAYLTPTSIRWNLGAQPIPVVIEAAARTIGARVVRTLDGAVVVQRPASAATADASRWLLIRYLVLAGGQLSGKDVGFGVPASCTTTFLDGTSNAVTLASLAISAYQGVTGVAGWAGRVTADPTTASSGQKTAYAQQAASDYYQWALSPTDATLRGFVDLDPNGYDGGVEWVHTDNAMVTRVLRPPWADRNVYATLAFGQGTGSGGGSGDPCDTALSPVTVLCSNGARTLTTSSLGLVKDGGTLALEACGSTDYSLGPCSPTNPAGQSVPIATAVCPSSCGPAVGDIIIKLASTPNSTCFLKADGSAVSRTTYAALFTLYGTTFGVGDGSTTFNLPTLTDPATDLSYFVVVGDPAPTVERILAVLPIADTRGCTTFAANDCCNVTGSGVSGSGQPEGECTLLCDRCPDGVTTVWVLTFPGEDPYYLYHVSSPDDGNYCRWVSDDLSLQLKYDYDAGLWLVEYLDDTPPRIWYTDPVDWACAGPNTVIAVDTTFNNGTLTAYYDCSTITYNCTGGVCEAVAGAGGTYATLAACQAACGGGVVDACGCATVPRTLYAHFTGALAALGTVTLSFTGPPPGVLVWNGATPSGTCLGSQPVVTFSCISGSTWAMTCAGLTGAFDASAVASSCGPFSWTGSGTATGTCAGAFTVTVNETP